ncbi:hypothetical protein evm_008622 [Chilo suppressalis]|nr:hypothetical protein evm_008622 [Chilo suppressalis]
MVCAERHRRQTASHLAHEKNGRGYGKCLCTLCKSDNRIIPGLKTNLKFIMMDFERASIKSVKETMPLDQRLLVPFYQSNLLSLARFRLEECFIFFCPRHSLSRLVEPEYQDSVNKFIDYLKNQWLRIAGIVFLWGSPTRTNNICESFHRWLSQRLDKLTNVIAEIEGKWQNLQRDGSAFGTKCFKQLKIDLYINNQQIALHNGRIDVAIEFYKKKTDQVEPEYQDSVNKFIDYLKNQWLRIAGIVFLWGSPTRTNNICESFHRWLSQRLGSHPSFYVFIDKLTNVIAEIEEKWQDLQRDGSAFGTKSFKQLKIDLYIYNQQIALHNGRIDVGEFLMKMKTRTVKDFIEFKLYSPHNVKDFNPEDIMGPEELADLLQYPRVMEVINHTTVKSVEVMKEKKSIITQDLEVRRMRQRKPAYLTHTSEIVTRQAKKKKTSRSTYYRISKE